MHRVRRHRGRVKTHAVVLHLKAPARMPVHPQVHPLGAGMLAHVGQRFLHHVQHLDLHVGCQRQTMAHHRQRGGHAGLVLKFG